MTLPCFDLRRRESDLFSGSSRADEGGTWGRSSGGGGSGGGGDSWGAPRRAESGDSAPSAGRKRLQLAPRTKPAPVIKADFRPHRSLSFLFCQKALDLLVCDSTFTRGPSHAS